MVFGYGYCGLSGLSHCRGRSDGLYSPCKSKENSRIDQKKTKEIIKIQLSQVLELKELKDDSSAICFSFKADVLHWKDYCLRSTSGSFALQRTFPLNHYAVV
jgi:hypothetical protein